MRMLALPALTLGLLVAAAPMAPTNAAPVGTMPIAAPDSAVDTVRHTRRHRAQQRRMMKRRMYRRSSPAKAGNSRTPERPGYQQNLGNTSGGPRR